MLDYIHTALDVQEYYSDMLALDAARRRLEATGDKLELVRFDRARARYEMALAEIGTIMHRAAPRDPVPLPCWAAWRAREADAAELLAVAGRA